MESARKTWSGSGWPPLEPEMPWYGYELGGWPAELERQARMAVAGDYSRWASNSRGCGAPTSA